MSINWVMIDNDGIFIRLPGERVIYSSPPRTTLSLQSANTYPGALPIAIESSAGTTYLTNQRLLYIPANPTREMQSFSAPILNLHNTFVSAPFFGPNYWSAVVEPVPGGGIPAAHHSLKLKMTFKDGGAFDFQQNFEHIKERLSQVVSLMRENGEGTSNSSHSARQGPLAGVNLADVHLEQLPAYEEASQSAPAAVPISAVNSVSGQTTVSSGPRIPESTASGQNATTTRPDQAATNDAASSLPDEPPPGYDEAQQQSVMEGMERLLRERS